MKIAETYEAVDKLWPRPVPPITRIEATRAAKRLARVFGDGYVPRTRRCWVTAVPSVNKGWERLAHDLSHTYYARRIRFAPTRVITGPHSGFHAKLEAEIVRHIVDRGWLNGVLRPSVTPPPAPSDRRRAKLAAARARLATWERRAKLATTKVKRYRAEVRRRTRAVERVPPAT